MTIEVIILKDQNGPFGTLELGFCKAYEKFLGREGIVKSVISLSWNLRESEAQDSQPK
ncbi:hypothetical protein Pryu01_01862 [Paraliobacillus ryukyuensis]|uniref:Uncharacterized protein n=1 Tax=Paraliobacillus ryukyuensis TaxID=200904 RepID=A0A366DSV5_9BACI|nr:hypothetical protein DES48_11338 [Paraliobacillus ryukyuensis]